jgi:hypothetical protein
VRETFARALPTFARPPPTFAAACRSFDAPSKSFAAACRSFDAPSKSFAAACRSFDAPSKSFAAVWGRLDAPRKSFVAVGGWLDAPRKILVAMWSQLDAAWYTELCNLSRRRRSLGAVMRLLEAADEPAFQALLRTVYGDTYSYRSLYETGGVAALIGSGRASLWGDFSEAGELLSHTAFLHKDPRGDYVESGMSFRGADAGRGTPDAVIWERLFLWLQDRCVFMHQSTTSWHPLAQRYAERYMRARPTGVIVDYAVDERLVGIPHRDGPMQALTMTSVVRADRVPSPGRRRLVPRGPWGEWLSGLLGDRGHREGAGGGAGGARARGDREEHGHRAPAACRGPRGGSAAGGAG